MAPGRRTGVPQNHSTWALLASDRRFFAKRSLHVLVATVDGSIWNINVGQMKNNNPTPVIKETRSPRVTIKIEDSEEDEIEEIEEVELWNDEDGLLEDITKLDSVLPAPKRLRTRSPPPPASSTHASQKHMLSNEPPSLCVRVDHTTHAIGTEVLRCIYGRGERNHSG
ncbi:hypothetical protein BGX28_008712 [Mortierella sp. GBA30]|nr:hypothetical protein BGX28_008712 [Mortierella sp. GBA30]